MKGRAVSAQSAPNLVWRLFENGDLLYILAAVKGSKIERELRSERRASVPAPMVDYAHMLLQEQPGDCVSFWGDVTGTLLPGIGGEFVRPTMRLNVIMTPNECYDNCEKLRPELPGYKQGFGHAFYDGYWVPHAWLTGPDGTIIETIDIPYEIYYDTPRADA